MFNIIEYLEDRGIPYATQGKNISSGWVGIHCPFCGDTNNHLGIKDFGFNCWRCGNKGNISKLIMEIESCHFHQANAIIESFERAGAYELKKDIRRRLGDDILPTEKTKEFPEIHLDYLSNRGFSFDIIQKYNLFACYTTGKYKYRIICPIIENGGIINFTTMAVSGQQPKYIHCSNDKAIIPMKECLYNIDTVKDVAIIVEGVTDVWRIGDGCVATMGLEYTSEQVKLLIDKGVKKAYVMFDSEDFAIRKARKLANTLNCFMKSETIELDSGDPGELTESQVKELRKEIFYGMD